MPYSVGLEQVRGPLGSRREHFLSGYDGPRAGEDCCVN